MPNLKNLSNLERWLFTNTPPTQLDSAEALYARMPRQRGGQLPLVDIPYDSRREEHWADAARITDYLAYTPKNHGLVIDIGPGDGWPALPIAAARPDLTVFGFDPSSLRTRVCNINSNQLDLMNAHFVTADAAALPLEEGSVDLTTAASSLEETAEPEVVFAEIFRVLRPGGVLRASYQNWQLEAPEIESVLLWDGLDDNLDPVRLYSYVRRLQTPGLERRYTLELPHEGEAARLHQFALEASAESRRVYGETLMTASLGIELLEQLVPYVRKSTVVNLSRWTTAWLVDALKRTGFCRVHATAHPGVLARHMGRALISTSPVEALTHGFEVWPHILGQAAGRLPGTGMIAAWR